MTNSPHHVFCSQDEMLNLGTQIRSCATELKCAPNLSLLKSSIGLLLKLAISGFENRDYDLYAERKDLEELCEVLSNLCRPGSNFELNGTLASPVKNLAGILCDYLATAELVPSEVVQKRSLLNQLRLAAGVVQNAFAQYRQENFDNPLDTTFAI